MKVTNAQELTQRIAELRKAMDDNNVTYQFSELGKVDAGGGGTIAYILAQYNMEVIDCGVALHNNPTCKESDYHTLVTINL